MFGKSAKLSSVVSARARAITVVVVVAFAIAPAAHARSMRDASNNPAMDTDLQTSAGQSDGDADYRLGSGDKVRVSVFNQRDLTDVYQVDGLGRIAFPLVGQIQA